MIYHRPGPSRIEEVDHEPKRGGGAGRRRLRGGCVDGGRDERTGTRPRMRHAFTQVDVTGDAAVVRLELHRDGKHTFTDYLSLYRFPEGWKIVSKTFQSHAS